MSLIALHKIHEIKKKCVAENVDGRQFAADGYKNDRNKSYGWSDNRQMISSSNAMCSCTYK